MLTSDNYECTWDLFKAIPSLQHEGKSVFDETVEFNEKHRSHSLARLIDSRRAKVPVTSMGFSKQDRLELLKLSTTDEAELGNSCITDWLSPDFFTTAFWFMWATTFAFQPWHSAVEFKRYLHRFMLEFSRIETLAGVKRTVYNQYDSMVVSLQRWLESQGVRMVTDCRVTDLDESVYISPFLFFNALGKCYVDEAKCTASGFNSMWQNFMCRLVAESKLVERFTEHDLRAKCASDATTLETACKLLAHVDSRMTARVYRRKPERV